MLRDINPRQDWNDRIKTIVSGAKKLKKLRALAAFNVVTDYVAHLDVARLSSELAKLPEEKRKKVLEKSHDEARHVEHPADVMAALLHGLRTGKASRVVASAEALKWLHDVFGEPKEKRIGGQAALLIQSSDICSTRLPFPIVLPLRGAKFLSRLSSINLHPVFSLPSRKVFLPLQHRQPATALQKVLRCNFQRWYRAEISLPDGGLIPVKSHPLYVSF